MKGHNSIVYMKNYALNSFHWIAGPGDPVQNQNQVNYSLGHFPALLQISSKSAHNIFRYSGHTQIKKINAGKNICCLGKVDKSNTTGLCVLK